MRARNWGFAAVCVLWAVPLPAQWFHYPTPGVPRLANGKPDLNAPAPKTADGKPDLSGVWLISNALPCPKDLRDGDNCIEKIPLSREAVDFGASVPGGLPYQPWAAALVKQRVADLSKDDPHARCMPPNFPRAFAFPHHQKFIQIPGLLVILDEFNASYRQIFTDGRPFPEDPQPSWSGYSSGKWEGDTLVVESVGFRDDLWLDMRGNPMTSAAKVSERFRRPAYGSLEIQVTVNDPKAYTKPWTVTLKEAIQVDTELADEICMENEKSVQHMTGK
ncbi:MAG TPA: hypothetical protein VK708_23045 [Bryobacteraceae bacterium]|jgi:hypothetical protein|nr:hypothetical protein [Bryobacteraceae bacterium]